MDLALVKTGLATLLQKNTTAAMDGIFSQVGIEGEGKDHILCSVYIMWMRNNHSYH